MQVLGEKHLGKMEVACTCLVAAACLFCLRSGRQLCGGIEGNDGWKMSGGGWEKDA